MLQLEILREARQPEFEVIAGADLRSTVGNGIPVYRDYHQLLARDDISAVAVNTPPREHYRMSVDALLAGKDVLVEKPPALTIRECRTMARLAQQVNEVLFMAFHARYSPVIAAASVHLALEKALHVDIRYREDVRRYHVGSDWVFDQQAGGGGVLMDSGINAMSIMTAILPESCCYQILEAAFGYTEGFNVETRADVTFTFGTGGIGRLVMDWMHEGPETRKITCTTTNHVYTIDLVQNSLHKDGNMLFGADRPTLQTVDQHREYRELYREFGRHLRNRKSHTSCTELEFVADAYTYRTCDPPATAS